MNANPGPAGPDFPAFDLDLDVIAEAPLPPALDPTQLRALVASVLRAERATGAWSVTVVLTDDERLRALHRDFMGLDTPTDVMTFPRGDPEPRSAGPQGGDVVVSVERAAAQAEEFGQTPTDEIRFLVVHGLLHLCGWEDTADVDRARMLDRQADLLRAFDGDRGRRAVGD